MRVALCCLLLSSFSVAVPLQSSDQSSKPLSEIQENDFILDPDGSFYYTTQLTDGTFFEATGFQNDVDGATILEVSGRYSHFTPTSHFVIVKYFADENGVRAHFTISRPLFQNVIDPKALESLVG